MNSTDTSITQERLDEAFHVHQLQEKIALLDDTASDKKDWLNAFFNKRERGLIANCIHYTHNSPAGLPGHNLMLVVSKMASVIEMLESQ